MSERARFFPSITYFAMPMALLAMAMNIFHLGNLLHWRHDVARWVAAYGLLSLLVLSAVYFRHFFSRGRDALIKEWQHPFQISFFPLMSISWLFVAFFIKVYGGAWLAVSLFSIIMVLHGLLNLFLINRWLFDHQLTIDHMRPSWFVLLSGNFVVVLVGMQISAFEEWMWLFYSAALFMWLMFVTLLLYRLIFVTPIEDQYRPSLFIFLAPPSLASVAGLTLFDSPWHLAIWGPYSFAFFMLLIWIISGKRFFRNGISMISWSYIFPLAAFGLANQYLYEHLHQPFFLWLAVAVLMSMVLFATLITAWLLKQFWLSRIGENFSD